jgi:LysM repeat protein
MIKRPMRTRLPLFAIIICISGSLLFADSPYTVKQGDTLYRIARQFGISVSALAAANGIKESDTLYEGKKIIIPAAAGTASSERSATPSPPSNPKSTITIQASASPGARRVTSEYTIRAGDTLYSIAHDHGMEMDELLSLNKITRNSVIKTGKKLFVYQALATARQSPKPSPQAGTTGRKVNAGLSWPVDGRLEYLDGKLYGVSITGKKGDPIRAVANGIVIQANTYRGYSGVIFVERADNMIYVYGGNDSILVKKGDKVLAGMKLGYLGLDSRTGQPSMSFMVFQNGKAIDPSLCPRD